MRTRSRRTWLVAALGIACILPSSMQGALIDRVPPLGAEAATLSAATPGTVQLQVTPIKGTGNFAPKHLLAIWVTDAAGKYIRTIRREAQNTNHMRHLYTWTAARGSDNTVDGYTGATPTTYAPITATWDGTDRNGNLVPDGIYRFRVEFTEKNAQGPITPVNYLEFTKGPQNMSYHPANLTSFKDMQVTFTAVPEATMLPLAAMGALALMRWRRA